MYFGNSELVIVRFMCLTQTVTYGFQLGRLLNMYAVWTSLRTAEAAQIVFAVPINWQTSASWALHVAEQSAEQGQERPHTEAEGRHGRSARGRRGV